MNIINRYTLQTLKKNKMRTLVTIVGIILSTAMFTGVTSLISSFQQFEIDMEINERGTWEGRLNQLSEEEVQKFLDGGDVEDSTSIRHVGYSLLKDCLNEDKPYLCVASVDKQFEELGAFHIREGRMPKNNGEIVLPVHLEENGGISYQVGDTLSLEVGKRTVQGELVGQIPYSGEDLEKLEDCRVKQYTVVGICERNPYEDYEAAGYTAFTTGEKDTLFQDVLFTSKNTKEIDKQIKNFLTKTLGRKKSEIEAGIDFDTHVGLLRITGEYQGQTYKNAIIPMAAFLILIIMVASVTLIYNAFSISLSERTKQFGLLKSIGATKKQIRHGVYFEALSLCMIGIPLGVGSGLIGIAITLYFVGDLMKEFINASGDLSLHLSVYPIAIVISVVVAVITVLISAMIPARRAVKMTAIEALRESQDIRIRSRRIRSSKLVYLLFGFEGMLANKNFKRNRKKYRLTVFSIVISIVLFVGSSTFNLAMNTSLDIYSNEETADVSLFIQDDDMNDVDEESARNKLGALQYVDDVAYSKSVQNAYLVLGKEDINEEYYEVNMKGRKAFEENGDNDKSVYVSPNFLAKNTGDKVLIPVEIQFVDDKSYEQYLKENRLDVSKYMDSKNLHPVIWDEVMMYAEGGTIARYRVLRDDVLPKELYCVNKVKGYEYYEDVTNIDIKTMEFPFEKKQSKNNSDDEPETTALPAKKALTNVSLDGGVVVDYKAPLGINSINRWFGSMTMTLPYSAKDRLSGSIQMTDGTEFNFAAKEYRKANTSLSNFLQGDATFGRKSVSGIYNVRESEDASRALMLVIGIFTYGFIILITLIVVANVFNTISTNILLRRKEFAMLKSVGMTKSGSNRMMNFECLLYGVKGIVIGLPISIIVSYLLCKSLSGSISLGILIPWGSIVTVVIGVFVVVFASMLYSMQKIKKDNPIDALKNDVI